MFSSTLTVQVIFSSRALDEAFTTLFFSFFLTEQILKDKYRKSVKRQCRSYSDPFSMADLLADNNQHLE